jgi:hypothetical protein
LSGLPTTNQWRSGSGSISAKVLLDDETNIQGRSVNLAVRIQPFAPPGGICLSAAVQDVVQGSHGIILRALGLKVLKNIAEPVEVFVVERETPSPAAVVVLPSPGQAVAPPAEASVAVCDGITQVRRPAGHGALSELLDRALAQRSA